MRVFTVISLRDVILSSFTVKLQGTVFSCAFFVRFHCQRCRDVLGNYFQDSVNPDISTDNPEKRRG